MSDWRFILRFLGILLIAEGCAMLLCLVAVFHFHDSPIYEVLISAGVSLAVGIILLRANRRCTTISDHRKSYLMVTLMWLVLSLFGAIPFLSIGRGVSFSEALFESTSGLTATGATIFADVEALPSWILLWRSISQWFGGFGFILLVLAIAPTLGINKYSLYSAEVSGADNTGKTSIRMSVTVRKMLVTYLLLTVFFVGVLLASGLNLWDATNLVLTNISSGGFSLYNNGIVSLTHVQQFILAVAMLLSGVSFALIYDVLRFRFRRIKSGSDQLRFYVTVVVVASLFVSLLLHFADGYEWGKAIRCGAIQSISAITTSGTLVENTSGWFMPINYLLVMLSLCGAMAGSTTGGLKSMRVLILLRNLRTLVQNSMHPNAVNPVRLNGKPVQQSLINNVLVIFFVYLISFMVGVLGLMFCGINATESIGAVAGCISGYGPGLGASGGFGCYAGFTSSAKVICSILMILGRLECLSVLIVFSRKFWR